jgi:hypothetical protein
MKIYIANMLTKTDLNAIDKIIKKRIREEVEAEGKNIRDELKTDIINSRMRIRYSIKDLADRVKNLEIRVNNFEKNTQKEFKELDKRFTELFDFLDKDQLKIQKQVDKLPRVK